MLTLNFIISIGGVDQPIDVADLKANTVYGEFVGDETDETIINFWSVVEEFDKDQRSALVKFVGIFLYSFSCMNIIDKFIELQVTSCARPPLLGFSELYPKFAIRKAGNDETRLPTSSTCVNLLKLPPYKDRATLKSKLLCELNLLLFLWSITDFIIYSTDAVNSGAGFDLS